MIAMLEIIKGDTAYRFPAALWFNSHAVDTLVYLPLGNPIAFLFTHDRVTLHDHSLDTFFKTLAPSYDQLVVAYSASIR